MIVIGRLILVAIIALYLVPAARTFQCPPGLTWEALPDPSDCSHYFLCVGSQAHHRACSPHLYFNPLTERCDSASKPYCAANSSSLPTFNNTAVHMTAPPPTTSPPTFKCPSNQTVQYPDITNCSFYFFCQNGSSVKLECTNGTAFHVLSSSCVSVQPGQCPPLVALTTTPSPSSATTSSAAQLNSSLPASPFPGASQPASAQSSQPASAQSSTPFPIPPLGPSTPFKCPPDSGNRLYADDTSCNYYYECVGRLAYRMPCADGLHFNPITQLCDYPYIVNCAIPPTNVSVSPSAFECPRVPTNPANLYPDPHNCGYFYQCAGTRAFHIACQPGLHFQPYIYVCVRPEQSSCFNGSGESGEGSGGSGESGEGSGGSGDSSFNDTTSSII